MFQDMGDVSGEAFEILRTKAQARLTQWLDSGDYIGWLATPADKPETIIETKREAIAWTNTHPHFMTLHIVRPGSHSEPPGP